MIGEGIDTKPIPALMLALALVCFLAIPRGPLHAGFPYAGLWGDTLGGPGGANRSVCGINYIPAAYSSIEVWVWFLPIPEMGLAATEFKITYPTTTYVIQCAVTSNPLNQVELGSLGAGMSVSVGSANCQYGWYWTHWQEIFVKKIDVARTITLVGHPGNGGHILVSCCLGGPCCAHDATVINHLNLNQQCLIGTHEMSWGAIKNLYNE